MIGFGQGSEESFRASAVLVSLIYSPLQEPVYVLRLKDDSVGKQRQVGMQAECAT